MKEIDTEGGRADVGIGGRIGGMVGGKADVRIGLVLRGRYGKFEQDWANPGKRADLCLVNIGDKEQLVIQ